jgi:bacterioferritin-associated ferredoxin
MSKTICYCENVSEEEILDAINNGAKRLKDIQEKIGASTGNQCKISNSSSICCSGDNEKLLNTSYTFKDYSSCYG